MFEKSQVSYIMNRREYVTPAYGVTLSPHPLPLTITVNIVSKSIIQLKAFLRNLKILLKSLRGDIPYKNSSCYFMSCIVHYSFRFSWAYAF